MSSFCAAFFKGTSPGLGALIDWAIHTATEGQYSHCELVFSDGRSASSVPGAGVRFTAAGSINFSDATQWDLIDLSGLDEASALEVFNKNLGNAYDYRGDAHFALDLVHHDAHDDFCSEICGYALGLEQSWRFDPNALSVVVKRLARLAQLKTA
jgi:hypothetical protein